MGGCISYRKKKYRERKGRGNRDAFWYEWKTEMESEIERGGQSVSEVQQGGNGGDRGNREGGIGD